MADLYLVTNTGYGASDIVLRTAAAATPEVVGGPVWDQVRLPVARVIRKAGAVHLAVFIEGVGRLSTTGRIGTRSALTATSTTGRTRGALALTVNAESGRATAATGGHISTPVLLSGHPAPGASIDPEDDELIALNLL